MQPLISHVRDDGYQLSDDPAWLDFAAIHAFLTRTYWSPGIPRETVERAARASWCVGVYAPDGTQVGFARMITDYATFGYLADVYVTEAHRGRGLSKWMMDAIFSTDIAKGLRRTLLATRDAHGLYARSGFTPLGAPDRIMEINRPDIYAAAKDERGAA